MNRQPTNPLSTRRRKAGLRVLAGLAVGAVSALTVGGPAWADSGDDGEVLAAPIPLGHAALIYVGIPLAIIGMIWLLASIPSMVNAPRYRPGLSWWANPIWFNGPAGEVSAAAGETAPPASDAGTVVPTGHEGGGTSARW